MSLSLSIFVVVIITPVVIVVVVIGIVVGIVVVVVVVPPHEQVLMGWGLGGVLSLQVGGTHNPPCKQWLVRLEAGAMSLL